MKKSALALAAVLVLALTVFVSTGSATNTQPKQPFGSVGFSSGPDQDVRGVRAPRVDVRVHAPKMDVRGHAAPHAIKPWASKGW